MLDNYDYAIPTNGDMENVLIRLVSAGYHIHAEPILSIAEFMRIWGNREFKFVLVDTGRKQLCGSAVKSGAYSITIDKFLDKIHHQQPTNQPTTENTNTMLIRVTIMATERVAPNAVQQPEEILVPTIDVSAKDRDMAIILVATTNAETINKVKATHDLRVIAKTEG